MKQSRIMLAAGASGNGKTLLTCGLLQALLLRGIKTASFKCGPDYIDPMFHRQVLGTVSGNLDLFFTSREMTRYLLETQAKDCDLAVIEGVMGYYDGLAGMTAEASSYDLACATDTPVILIVNSRGMSTSLAAYLKGFLTYREDSRIRGVILNQMPRMLYLRLKPFLEKETQIPVVGYVPDIREFTIDNRHLGLVLPEEIPELQDKLKKLAMVLEETLDIDQILHIAESAPGLPENLDIDRILHIAGSAPGLPASLKGDFPAGHMPRPLRIGVARDEAFCFIYPENIRLLEQMGAQVRYFSPLRDQTLPGNLDGLLLYGGYPELHAKALSENHSMRTSICQEVQAGLPVMAECGGFLYLQEELEDMQGISRSMLGVLPGKGFRTPRLSRFGYIYLSESMETQKIGRKALGRFTAHEFHYFDSTECGDAYIAKKPLSERSWSCIHDDGQIFAGFPHFYYYGNPQLPEMFLERCAHYRKYTKD